MNTKFNTSPPTNVSEEATEADVSKKWNAEDREFRGGAKGRHGLVEDSIVKKPTAAVSTRENDKSDS